MATGNLAVNSANTANQSYVYEAPSIQTMQFELAIVGVETAVGGALNSNGSYVLFAAPANSQVFATNFTIAAPGTGATTTGNVTVYKIAANNASNLSSNIQVGNVAVLGTNVAGNVATTGQYTYNVNSAANATNSGSNIAFPGGLTLQGGDLLLGVYTGNTGLVAAVTQYHLNQQALVVA